MFKEFEVSTKKILTYFIEDYEEKSLEPKGNGKKLFIALITIFAEFPLFLIIL